MANLDRLRQAEELGRMKNLGLQPASARITDPSFSSVTPRATPSNPVVDVTPEKSSFLQNLVGGIKGVAGGIYNRATQTADRTTPPVVQPVSTNDQLANINRPYIDEADRQLSQAQMAQQSGIEREKADLQARLSEIEKQQQAVYAPQFEVARRGQERAVETARRGASFRGFGRSSDALDTESELNDLALMQDAAIAAQQSASISLAQAVARGESDDVLKTLQDNVTAAQTASDALKVELAEKQAGLTAAQVEAGQLAESEQLDRQIQALKDLGLAVHPQTGETLATMEQKKLDLDAQTAAGKQTVAEGELLLGAGDLDLKTKLTTAQIGKLQAETAKLLRAASGGGGGGTASLPKLNVDANGIVQTDIDPTILNTAAVLYRNAGQDTQAAIEAAGGFGLSTKDEGAVANAVQTIGLLNDVAANENMKLDFNPRLGLSFIKPTPVAPSQPNAFVQGFTAPLKGVKNIFTAPFQAKEAGQALKNIINR